MVPCGWLGGGAGGQAALNNQGGWEGERVAGHRRDSAVRTTTRDMVDMAGDRNYGLASPTAAHPTTETQAHVNYDCGTEHICKFW